MVVLLCIAMARVLVIVYLLVGILCLWCHNVVEAASRFLGLVAEAVGGVGLAFVAEVELVMGVVYHPCCHCSNYNTSTTFLQWLLQ
jgi:hypothetical protein